MHPKFSYICVGILFSLMRQAVSPVFAQSNPWRTQAHELVQAEEYAQADALHRENVGSLHGIARAGELSWWGGCLRHLGAYKDAELKYLEAKDLYKDYGEEMVDRTRINLAILYNDMGRYDEAIHVLDSVTTPRLLPYASLYKAGTLFRKGKIDTSIELCTRLLSTDSTDTKFASLVHNNRAYMLMERSDEASLQKACADLNVALNLFDAHKDERYIALSNLAVVQARLRNYTQALANINTAVAWFSRRQQINSGSYTDYGIVLRKRAEILLLMNRKEEATAAYKEYFLHERKYLQYNFARFTEQNRLDIWKKERPLLSAMFALEQDAPDFLLDVALFRREVALLGGTPATKADSLKLVAKINRNLNLRGTDICCSLSADEIVLDFVKYEKVDSATNESTAWLAAIVIPPASSGEEVAFIPLFKECELTQFRINYHTLNEAVCSPAKVRDKNAIYTNVDLAKKIWEPVKSYIKGAKRLYFSPDGLFHMLAIEYLYPLTDSLSNLQIYRITSPSQLVGRTKNKANSAQKILAIGGLDYDKVSDNTNDSDEAADHDAINYLSQHFAGRYGFFRYLPGSRKEVMDIDSLCVAVDTSFVETEEMLKKTLQTKIYRHIHLATHAYALQVYGETLPYALRDSITEDRSLLASGIALSGANNAYKEVNREDGIISAREFCSLDLGNIDLMVVSACRSAQGVANDEGPAGLVRGLKKAGVNSIVATLWEVDDNAANLFMRAFYGSLNAGNDKHAALIDAQNALKNHTLTRKRAVFDAARLASRYVEETISPYTAPYYWAPFILIDN